MVIPRKEKRRHAKKHDPTKKKGKNKGESESIRSKSYHHLSHSHTHAHLDHIRMICFSTDSFFVFTIYEMQVCLVPLSYLELHKSLEAEIALVRFHTH